jgi:hypothetical protein
MSVDPLTIAIGSTIAQAGMGIIQAKAAGDAEDARLRYQQQVAANNAAIAEDSRKRAVQASTVAAADKDLEASAILGEIMAEGGASGLSLTSGSKAAKRASAQKLSARDRARIRHEGELEAGRFAQERTGFENRGVNIGAARGANRSATRLSMASTLVSGATKSARAYSKYKLETKKV